MSWMRPLGTYPTLHPLRLGTLIGALASILLWPAPALAATPWAQVTAPSRGPSQSIGGAASGCVGGAAVLPETGPGYVSVRRVRNRYYGHPALIRMLEDLGRTADRRGGGMVVVGDLSQPRGGRMPSSHRSHQNGLDADIWFTMAPSPEAARRSMDDRPDPPSMVQPDGIFLSSAWGPDQRFLLEATARQPAVDRIFVNAAIKRGLCQEVKGDRSWLRKLRPWFGHDSHFHLRLRCPPGSPQCEPQAALPPGDGCGEDLSWWFSAEARSPLKKKGPPKAEPPVPAACMGLLREP